MWTPPSNETYLKRTVFQLQTGPASEVIVSYQVELSVAELKARYKETYVTSVVQVLLARFFSFKIQRCWEGYGMQKRDGLQCGGNRRADMQRFKKVIAYSHFPVAQFHNFLASHKQREFKLSEDLDKWTSHVVR